MTKKLHNWLPLIVELRQILAEQDEEWKMKTISKFPKLAWFFKLLFENELVHTAFKSINKREILLT